PSLSLSTLAAAASCPASCLSSRSRALEPPNSRIRLLSMRMRSRICATCSRAAALRASSTWALSESPKARAAWPAFFRARPSVCCTTFFSAGPGGATASVRWTGGCGRRSKRTTMGCAPCRLQPRIGLRAGKLILFCAPKKGPTGPFSVRRRRLLHLHGAVLRQVGVPGEGLFQHVRGVAATGLGFLQVVDRLALVVRVHAVVDDAFGRFDRG